MIYLFYLVVGVLLFLAGVGVSDPGDRTSGKVCIILAFLCIFFRFIFTADTRTPRFESKTLLTNQVEARSFTFNSKKVFRVERYTKDNYGLAPDHEYIEFYDPEDGEVGSYVIQIHTPWMRVRPKK